MSSLQERSVIKILVKMKEKLEASKTHTYNTTQVE